MAKKRVFWWGLGLLALGMGTTATVQGQSLRQTAKVRATSPEAVEDRWRESLEAFAALDKLQAPRPGGVLFVGSSSIRLWDGLETAFQPTPVLRRGFGGSLMRDCARYVEQLVLPHAPRMVVVYAGDNDLAEGHAPAEVLQSFATFVERVRAALPGTRIAYLSIKPSPSRSALMAQAREANRLIADYAATQPNLVFIDIYAKMLDDQGRPRADLFAGDALHLNSDGYALWQSVIAGHLTPLSAPPSAPPSARPPAPLAAAAP
jgi:lysophospholipase L1-like esterase